jgi:hypothetical protein
MNRLLLGTFIGALTLAGQGSAYGGDRDSATAEALFQQARAEVTAGKYDAACPRFEESFRLDPTVGTLLNMADCAEHLGHVAAALAHFSDALGQLPAGDDRATYVKARVARLKPRVPELEIDAASAEPMTVLRDQVEMGPAALNLPLPVEPGPHVIVVRAPGHKDSEVRVDLVEGASQHVRAEPGPPLPSPVGPVPVTSPSAALLPSSPPPSAPRNGRGALPWVAGSVGLAGLLVGAGAGILALTDASTVRDHCPTHTCSGGDFTTANDAATRGKLMSTISTTGFGVGLAGIAVATYLWLRPTSRSTVTGGSERSVGHGADAWMAPWAGPGGAGLAAGGSFE